MALGGRDLCGGGEGWAEAVRWLCSWACGHTGVRQLFASPTVPWSTGASSGHFRPGRANGPHQLGPECSPFVAGPLSHTCSPQHPFEWVSVSARTPSIRSPPGWREERKAERAWRTWAGAEFEFRPTCCTQGLASAFFCPTGARPPLRRRGHPQLQAGRRAQPEVTSKGLECIQRWRPWQTSARPRQMARPPQSGARSQRVSLV